MRSGKRGRYTLEFKQAAVRLIESGQTLASAAHSLGVVEQTLGNYWVKLHRAGALKDVSGKSGVTAEQMEISRLRAELARVTMERDILGKATAFFAKGQKSSTPLSNTTSGSGQSGCSAVIIVTDRNLGERVRNFERIQESTACDIGFDLPMSPPVP